MTDGGKHGGWVVGGKTPTKKNLLLGERGHKKGKEYALLKRKKKKRKRASKKKVYVWKRGVFQSE